MDPGCEGDFYTWDAYGSHTIHNKNGKILSEGVYISKKASAAAVAAHECGHAVHACAKTAYEC